MWEHCCIPDNPYETFMRGKNTKKIEILFCIGNEKKNFNYIFIYICNKSTSWKYNNTEPKILLLHLKNGKESFKFIISSRIKLIYTNIKTNLEQHINFFASFKLKFCTKYKIWFWTRPKRKCLQLFIFNFPVHCKITEMHVLEGVEWPHSFFRNGRVWWEKLKNCKS